MKMCVGYCVEIDLNFVVAEFVGNIGVLGAPFGLAATVVQCSTTLGCTSMCWIRLASR